VRYGVDWILLCPSIVENSHFSYGLGAEPTLYRRLLDGTAPPWLQVVALDEELRDSIRLFAIDPEAGPAGPSTKP
jgi:hypothetical protein